MENRPMPQTPVLDPDRVAYFERAGWQAYYDRNWPRVFWLMVQLNQEAVPHVAADRARRVPLISCGPALPLRHRSQRRAGGHRASAAVL